MLFRSFRPFCRSAPVCLCDSLCLSSSSRCSYVALSFFLPAFTPSILLALVASFVPCRLPPLPPSHLLCFFFPSISPFFLSSLICLCLCVLCPSFVTVSDFKSIGSFNEPRPPTISPSRAIPLRLPAMPLLRASRSLDVNHLSTGRPLKL